MEGRGKVILILLLFDGSQNVIAWWLVTPGRGFNQASEAVEGPSSPADQKFFDVFQASVFGYRQPAKAHVRPTQ
jgi:hypothetical protein